MSETEIRTIAVLGGAGHEGAGLAARWAKAGYRVVIGSRDAQRSAEAAARIAERTGGTAEGTTNEEAAAAGDLVVLAVPYSAQASLAQAVRPQLEGKILVDVTVPLVPPKVARVQLPEGGSAVEALQRLLGEGVRVVSAFQNVAAHQLDDLDHPVNCDVLVSGDNEAAREAVCQVAQAAGMNAWHAGPLCNSAAAEALTSVLIFMNKRYKIAEGAGIRISGMPSA